MTEQEEPDASGATSAGTTDEPAPRPRPRTAWWLRVVLFAAGLVVGVLVVGLLDSTTPDFATTSGSGGASPGGAASPAGGGAGVEARVNAACLAVINDAQDVYAALGDLGPALDDNDLTALDDIVRRLQPVEPRLAADLQNCRVDTSVGQGGTPPGTSSPTAPVPTAPVPTTPVPATPVPPAQATTAPVPPAPTTTAPLPPGPPGPQPTPTQ